MCSTNGGDCSVATSVAHCPAGYWAVGGGYGSTTVATVPFSAATDASSYTVIALNDETQSGTLVAQAICANGPNARAFASEKANAGINAVALLAHLRSLRSASRSTATR
jgi:hypothetical protein